jgi:hypothetical protein
MWIRPGLIPGLLPGKLSARVRTRYHPDLENAQIHDFTLAHMSREIWLQLLGKRLTWDATMSRNEWFQERVVGLMQSRAWPKPPPGRQQILMAYSYAARRPFKKAIEFGCKTVLYQIDAGPVEEEIVAEKHARHAGLHPSWSRAPKIYWQRWREECELADHIVVNSPWSRDALIDAGVPSYKLSTIPLIQEGSSAHAGIARQYPSRFHERRPLKVLFLGSLVLRKGIAELFQAIELLKREPIEFWLVGRSDFAPPKNILENPNVRWAGPVPHGYVDRYFQTCDVFILPTHSDGFGLTQLEAMFWGLPVIASRHCGDVVRPGENGILLEHVNAESIREALQWCITHPESIAAMSENAITADPRFSESTVIEKLEALGSLQPLGAAGPAKHNGFLPAHPRNREKAPE